MTKWTSRKLAVAVGCQVLFTALLFYGKIPPETYYNLTMVGIGGYMVGNVAEHFANRK